MDNDKVMKYKDALVEVEAALNCLELEAFNKIPKELISAIEKNKNTDYEYCYDEDLDYEDWNFSIEARALLYNIYEKYLATEDEKICLAEREIKEKDIFEKVKWIIIEQLDAYEKSVQSDVSLSDGLGADSLDVVEL